jgi:general secretion pathway protein G
MRSIAALWISLEADMARQTAKRYSRFEEGYTLLELLVVLGIIAALSAIVAPRVIGYLGQAKSDAARAQLANVQSALELYYLDTGTYPTGDQGIDALIEAPANVSSWRGPYLKKDAGLIDPWGKKFVYAQPGEHGPFDLSSLGRDGKIGGEGEDGDFVSW